MAGSVTLLKAIPALPVRHIRDAAQFYRSRLGFEVGHEDEAFGIVTRDGVELHIWAASDASWSRREGAATAAPVVSGAESFLAGTASCRIEVNGIDELYAELQGSGVLYAAGTVVEDTPWGTREFPVLDLDRNLLTFYQRTDC